MATLIKLPRKFRIIAPLNPRINGKSFDKISIPGSFFDSIYTLVDDVEPKTDAEKEFFDWLVKEILVTDEEWENKSTAFPELCCRKLVVLGILKLDGDTYIWNKPDKGEL